MEAEQERDHDRRSTTTSIRISSWTYTDPQKVIHFSVEGNVSFTALLFIPGKAPMNYYSQDYKKGLQLYSRGVFIMDKAEELIPEHFRFVKGLVDSQDLSAEHLS